MPTNTKLCRKCGHTKDVESFGADKNSPDGRRYECKQCRSEHDKKIYEESKDKSAERNKKYRDKNRSAIRAKGREYHQEHKEQAVLYRKENAESIRANAKAYRTRIRSKSIAYLRDYYRQNKESLLVKQKEYAENNKGKIQKRQREYAKANRPSIRARFSAWQKQRKQSDVGYRILCNLRRHVNRAIRKTEKSAKTKELIGCSMAELRAHLESMFLVGMTWANYGQWHVDHIIPCCKFDMSNPEEQRRCYNWKNLQPLWAVDNIRKGGRVPA
jgi:hypothetical protein